MSQETSTLREQSSLDSHTFSLRQSRWTLWGILTFLLAGIVGVLGFLLSGWFMLAGGLMLCLAMLLMFADRVIPGRAVVTLSGHQIHISRWSGTLPRPAPDRTFLLGGMQVAIEQTGAVHNTTTFALVFRNEQGVVESIEGLIGTRAELDRIRDTMSDAFQHARERQGGVAEIPDELRELMTSTPNLTDGQAQ